MRVTFAKQTFNAGELAPELYGRFDLDIYYAGLQWCENFTVSSEGEANYRDGFRFVWPTRDNQLAVLVPFKQGTIQAYMLEFTALKMRVFKDGGIVTLTPQTVTGITKTNPAVVTYSGSDTYSNGDRIILQDIGGMIEVTNREFTVANVNTGANTFELSGINSTAYTTYTSGGTVAEIAEFTTVYPEAVLFEVQYTQDADIMYLTHGSYRTKQLTRSSHTAWAFSEFANTGGPFQALNTTATTMQVTTGTPTVAGNAITITATTATFTDAAMVGGLWYFDIAAPATPSITFGSARMTARTSDTVADFVVVEPLGSGLTGTPSTKWKKPQWDGVLGWPVAVCFYEQRLFLAGNATYPGRIWGSKITEYTNFTTGTGATDSVEYTLATSSGQVPKIRWIAPTDTFLAVGTYGFENVMSGGGQYSSISPTSISVKPISNYGVHNILPVPVDSSLHYVQRNELTIRSIQYDAYKNGFTSPNKTVRSKRITKSGITQLAVQQSETEHFLWQVRNDGRLACATIEPYEKVLGFHKHKTQGSWRSAATIPQRRDRDQLWVVAERVVGGVTKRYVEYMADQPEVPQFLDYFTDVKEDDEASFLNAMWEAQKRMFFVDSGIVYDGSEVATVTMTPAAITGSTVNFTAGASFFTSDMVGNEIWGMPEGRAVILSITNPTVAVCRITVDFPSTATMAINGWYLTASQFSGAEHLEGLEAVVMTDGGYAGAQTITNGMASVDYQVSYAVIGLDYRGLMKTMNLEAGGANGPAQTKPKSVANLGVRFRETLGAKFGTDLYNLERVDFRSTADLTDRPAPLFTGDKIVPVSDDWDEEKYIYVVQDKPFPCNIQMLVPYMATNDT